MKFKVNDSCPVGLTSRDLFTRIISRQTSRAILNFLLENLLRQGVTQTLNEFSQLFIRVKEFNVFGSNEIKVIDLEQAGDTFRLKISKGKLIISAKIILKGGYPKVPPIWSLQLEG